MRYQHILFPSNVYQTKIEKQVEFSKNGSSYNDFSLQKKTKNL